MMTQAILMLELQSVLKKKNGKRKSNAPNSYDSGSSSFSIPNNQGFNPRQKNF
jgi:hypothetical protein